MSEVPTLTFDGGGWCKELGRSYWPGQYQPKSMAEYEALKPYSVSAGPVVWESRTSEPTVKDSFTVAPKPHDEPPGNPPVEKPFDTSHATRAEMLAFCKANGLSANPSQSTDALKKAIANFLRH